METERKSEFPIHPVFTDRWSPRSFTGEEMHDSVLMTCLEAGRWASSASNTQPWRFIYAKRGSPQWETFLGFLSEQNQVWARNASVLVVLVSRMMFPRKDARDGDYFSASHSFDSGAAWANIALQATLLGWHAHGMMNFDPVKASRGVRLPEGYHVEMMFALGRKAGADRLPEELRKREVPTGRLPLKELVMQGTFAPAPMEE